MKSGKIIQLSQDQQILLYNSWLLSIGGRTGLFCCLFFISSWSREGRKHGSSFFGDLNSFVVSTWWRVRVVPAILVLHIVQGVFQWRKTIWVFFLFRYFGPISRQGGCSWGWWWSLGHPGQHSQDLVGKVHKRFRPILSLDIRPEVEESIERQRPGWGLIDCADNSRGGRITENFPHYAKIWYEEDGNLWHSGAVRIIYSAKHSHWTQSHSLNHPYHTPYSVPYSLGLIQLTQQFSEYKFKVKTMITSERRSGDKW